MRRGQEGGTLGDGQDPEQVGMSGDIHPQPPGKKELVVLWCPPGPYLSPDFCCGLSG